MFPSACRQCDPVRTSSIFAVHISMRAPALRQFLDGERRLVSAAAPAIILLTSLRHDRAAHRGGTEGDEERSEQQNKRNAACAVGEDQLAQMPGVEPEQAADEKRRGAGADREVDGEQAEERDAQQGGAGWFRLLIVGHGGSPHAGSTHH
ncbi:bll7347 [Bradyrhizobium diazoefficiens USDA 110]|uniref:Bll7347 protein n=1 Tax=Bradyrhizobium diazoefficiens (strain JCM 10833 / BCRC 13528 / IAM 13628 / NBRC 14792 / USDA 110) TaxID=224911 RepID=Q89DU1_BRADU|nr:hypothetical protein CO678_19480 [Bradyrhizobium diazoefficiens]QBP26090.1 hypothetical protein Bdiaspc4_38755 [Bradyrhizobium diazoefficiens]BAC52612.1 bll7347 [Bradyrhizobium diazoefficiens USDA 110]